jgi:hypothetical protein
MVRRESRMILSPVCGFLPFLAHLNLIWNLPNPRMRTSSPRASAAFMISNRELTISVARRRVRNTQSISGNKNCCLPLGVFLKRTSCRTRWMISVLFNDMIGKLWDLGNHVKTLDNACCGDDTFSKVPGGRPPSFHRVTDGGPPGSRSEGSGEQGGGRPARHREPLRRGGRASPVCNSIEMTRPGASVLKKRHHHLAIFAYSVQKSFARALRFFHNSPFWAKSVIPLP